MTMDVTVISRARASALLFGAASLLSNASRGRAQTSATLRIATLPIESAAEPFYAKDMGFFAKAGLDVDIQTMQTSAAMAAAAASNAIDIGYSPVDSMATIHSRKVPVVVIAPANEYISPSRNAGLALPANSPVHQAKDLNGKIIAVSNLRSLSENAARAWMDRNGGDSSTAKFVEIPFPAMQPALDTGHVDAAWVAEPFISAAAKNGRIIEYGFDAIATRFLIGAWFTTAQWASDHRDLVTRFAAAIHETAVWANKNPGPSGQVVAKYTKIDPTVLATMTRSRYGEVLTAASMQPLIDISAKYNGFATFPAQELLYTGAK
jgi:ABC-type nitrate/sulfonate/bicarbonate transport system substrate-binding protein